MNPEKDSIEKAKEKAANEAVKLVKHDFVIGLGSGSTVAYAIEKIGDRIRRENLLVSGVPTSYQASTLAVKHGIPTTTLEQHPTLDLDIDGADQIDGKLNLIKGAGGALAREKVVASASRKVAIIADESKMVKTLGENECPVPLEILPFAVPLVLRKLKDMKATATVRKGTGKVGPVITDNGNVIVDANFGLLRDADGLDERLKRIVGVVETGLFVGMVSVAFLGTSSIVRKIERKG